MRNCNISNKSNEVHPTGGGLIALLMVLFLFEGPNYFCQADTLSSIKEDLFYRHRVTLLMANSHIPAATNLEGNNSYLIVPTWGFDYDFWFAKKFGAGLHTDLVLQQYKVEEHNDQKIIERSFPLAVNVVGLYKPLKRWSVLCGGGIEIEKSQNFAMFCLGLEYGIELPKAWEISINMVYENKIEIYDSWYFGFGFSKFLKRK